MMEKSLTDKSFLIIDENLKTIRETAGNAAIVSGRCCDDIKIMAVTKTVEPVLINYAIDCGIDLIGENKVQEFLGKINKLKLECCKTHLIGHLQTNKVKQIVGMVDMIQSVDSVKVAQEIGKKSIELDIITDVLMEINIGAETEKFGFSPEQADEKVHELSEIPGIMVCGLMTVPPVCGNENENRHFFSNMRCLFIDISAKKIDNVSMNILSMGMSADYEPAILEGSTLIRLGSAVFGIRKY
jgi:PLP dependent protein